MENAATDPFIRPMAAGRAQEMEEKITNRLKSYTESEYVPYASSVQDLEQKAQKAYQDFLSKAQDRRKRWQKTSLARCQIEQIAGILEEAKLGDPRFADCHVATPALHKDAKEKHRERVLQWYMENRDNTDLDAEKRLNLMSRAVRKNYISDDLTDDIEADENLRNLEKILGFNWAPREYTTIDLMSMKDLKARGDMYYKTIERMKGQILNREASGNALSSSSPDLKPISSAEFNNKDATLKIGLGASSSSSSRGDVTMKDEVNKNERTPSKSGNINDLDKSSALKSGLSPDPFEKHFVDKAMGREGYADTDANAVQGRRHKRLEEIRAALRLTEADFVTLSPRSRVGGMANIT